MTHGCNICYVVTIYDCNHVKFHDVDIFDIYKYYEYMNICMCYNHMCTHIVIPIWNWSQWGKQIVNMKFIFQLADELTS